MKKKLNRPTNKYDFYVDCTLLKFFHYLKLTTYLVLASQFVSQLNFDLVANNTLIQRAACI